MNHKQNAYVTNGIPSLILIFAVLTMVTLALTTYATSRSDLNASKASLDQTTAYYEACRQASLVYKNVETAVIKAREEAASKEEFYQAVSAIPDSCPPAVWDEESRGFIIDVEFSDTQTLRVLTECPYVLQEDQASLPMVEWKTMVTHEWEPHGEYQLFQSDSDGFAALFGQS